MHRFYHQDNPHYAHLDYSSKISSAQAMENGLSMPENGSFESKWKTIENEK